MKSIRQHLQETQSSISQISDTPRLDAELLLAHITKQDRTYLFSHSDEVLNNVQSEQLKYLTQRRMNGVPVAYLLGQREFYGLTLEVSPAVLVPRPETEHLVEIALNKIPIDVNWQLVDLGTGSGAIALALASERPNCTVIATDRSAAALAVAQRNAQNLKLTNLQFKRGSWTEALSSQYPIIVSNPPYVAENDQRLGDDSLRHEPRIALTPGNDGYTAIKAIVNGATKHLFNKGWLMLEHGNEQASRVRDELRHAGFQNIESQRDLAGHERVTLGQWLPG